MAHWHVMTWPVGGSRSTVRRHHEAFHMEAPSALCREYGCYAQLDHDTDTDAPYVRYLSACDTRHNL